LGTNNDRKIGIRLVNYRLTCFKLLNAINTRGGNDTDSLVRVIDGTEKGEERGIRVLHKPSMVMIDVLFK
jgi:hypothetical protein